MKLFNPFSDYGSIVTGDRFVGRTIEINHIEQRLLGNSFGNLAIIGLPRSGKSSLAWNALLAKKNDLLDRKIIVVWLPLGECSNLIEFLNVLVESIKDYLSLSKAEIEKELIPYIELFVQAQVSLEKRRFFKKILKKLKEWRGRLIAVIDEFDNAADIFSLQDFQFLREISYNAEIKIGIVTISRKTVQELEPGYGSLSNFYQIFDELRLKLFSNIDLIEYWGTIKKHGFKLTERYIDSICYYSGSHPYLLDLINFNIFNRAEGVESDLDKIFESVVDDLKLKIYNEYESILTLMQLERLDQKLVQVIVGPVYDITQRDVEKLLKYNLIELTKEGAYRCFALYFEEYLSLKSAEIDIWPLWTETETELRELIKHFLQEKYGEDDWTTKFVKANPKKVNPIEELKAIMAKNIKSFGERASKHLVDYTYPFHMFDCFIHSDWKWFADIFGRQFSDWKPKFDVLSEIRNPLAHNNRQFLSQSKLNMAIGYCQEIDGKIREWRQRYK